MLGIVSDEDTDGNGSKPRSNGQASSNGQTKPSSNGPDPAALMPTGAMVRKFHALGSSLNSDSFGFVAGMFVFG